MSNPKKKLAIIGGGISGLSAAYYLSKFNNFDIELFEKQDTLGGHAHTARHQGVAFDTTVVTYHMYAYPMLRVPLLETSQLGFRCLPSDCDYNLHMNNARFSSFCDMGRIAALMDYGALAKLLKKGFTPIISGQNIWIRRKTIVPISTILATAGYDLPAPELPESLRKWSDEGDQRFLLAMGLQRKY